MDITVLQDRVLLKRNEPDEKTVGGIVLAGIVKAEKYEATVVAVGEGKTSSDGIIIPTTVKVGNQVIYNPSAVIPVKVNGENLLVIKEEEIYAVID